MKRLALIIVLLGLLLFSVFAQTATNAPGAPASPVLNEIVSLLPNSCHGFTDLHLFLLLIGGWVTHANWGKILAGLSKIRNSGGAVFLALTFLWNRPKLSPIITTTPP